MTFHERDSFLQNTLQQAIQFPQVFHNMWKTKPFT
jgi:hypothetical protein